MRPHCSLSSTFWFCLVNSVTAPSFVNDMSFPGAVGFIEFSQKVYALRWSPSLNPEGIVSPAAYTSSFRKHTPLLW